MNPHDAAQALEWVASEYMLRWLRRVPSVSVTAFGRAVAVLCPDRADTDFLNTVHRLLPEDVDQVPAIAAHYRAAGVPATLELMPAPGFEALAAALSAAGARQTGFFAAHERDLDRSASAPVALPPGVGVEEAGARVDDFARLLLAGHEVPTDRLEDALATTRQQAGIEGARLYLATVDGIPAAAAVLFLAGDVGYLANASTPVLHRRRGCHTTLIRRRLADAAAAGCRRAATLTGWATQSHANMARAGFRTAYTKATWRLEPPG